MSKPLDPSGPSGREFCALEYSWAYDRQARCEIHGTPPQCHESLKAEVREGRALRERVEALAKEFGAPGYRGGMGPYERKVARRLSTILNPPEKEGT